MPILLSKTEEGTVGRRYQKFQFNDSSCFKRYQIAITRPYIGSLLLLVCLPPLISSQEPQDLGTSTTNNKKPGIYAGNPHIRLPFFTVSS